MLFDTAWMIIVVDTGCTGFDSFFITLAKMKNALCLNGRLECMNYKGAKTCWTQQL